MLNPRRSANRLIAGLDNHGSLLASHLSAFSRCFSLPRSRLSERARAWCVVFLVYPLTKCLALCLTVRLKKQIRQRRRRQSMRHSIFTSSKNQAQSKELSESLSCQSNEHHPMKTTTVQPQFSLYQLYWCDTGHMRLRKSIYAPAHDKYGLKSYNFGYNFTLFRCAPAPDTLHVPLL